MSTDKARATETAEVRAVRSTALPEGAKACPHCGNAVREMASDANIVQCGTCMHTSKVTSNGRLKLLQPSDERAGIECSHCGHETAYVADEDNLVACSVCGLVQEADGKKAVRLTLA